MGLLIRSDVLSSAPTSSGLCHVFLCFRSAVAMAGPVFSGRGTYTVNLGMSGTKSSSVPGAASSGQDAGLRQRCRRAPLRGERCEMVPAGRWPPPRSRSGVAVAPSELSNTFTANQGENERSGNQMPGHGRQMAYLTKNCGSGSGSAACGHLGLNSEGLAGRSRSLCIVQPHRDLEQPLCGC